MTVYDNGLKYYAWRIIAVIIIVVGIFWIFYAIDSDQAADCEALNGQYVRGGRGGSDLCYSEDGRLIKTY